MLLLLNFTPITQRFDATSLLLSQSKPQTVLTPNAAGQVQVDTTVINLGALLDAGFTIGMLTGTTAQRPALPSANQLYWDSTLNELIIRSPGNTAWTNTTGTVV